MIQANVIITEYKKKICVCSFLENRLTELQVAADDSLLSSIYIAKVKHISKNINAAFVELFDSQMAFLPLTDLVNAAFLTSKDGRLREGDELPVQVIKEAVKSKDPVVTTKLSISGAYAVVTLDTKQGGFQFSKKISTVKKAQLKEALKDTKLKKEYAVIIRTGAESLTDFSALHTELNALIAQMDAIVLRAKTRTCFSCIYEGAPSYMEYLHHNCDLAYEEIVTDLKDVYNKLQEHYKGKLPLRLYTDDFSLKKLYALESKLQELFARQVYLKSGATLVIDYTEAMTVIDVNTGKCTAKKEKEVLNYEINLQAAEEIARQLRLRNLSGIILIDFINMEKKEHEQQLITKLKSLLKQDTVACNFVDITALGLVEITRKKIRRPIYELFSE